MLRSPTNRRVLDMNSTVPCNEWRSQGWYSWRRSAAEMLRSLTRLRVLDMKAFSGAEVGCGGVIDTIAQLPALQVDTRLLSVRLVS